MAFREFMGCQLTTIEEDARYIGSISGAKIGQNYRSGYQEAAKAEITCIFGVSNLKWGSTNIGTLPDILGRTPGIAQK